jgi:ribosomal protein L11 methyltransferase
LGKAWPALDLHVPDCDPQLQELVLAELDDYQPTAIQEAGELSLLRAFFTSAEVRDSAARALATAFRKHLVISAIDVEDEDWAARSQEQLRAVTIGALTIAPPWDIPRSDPRTVPGSDPIIIRPSMGFGTGHHATTRLMLRALQEIPVRGRTVLDVGCGSGVLAIAAVRLGAQSAVGVDIDPDALGNAADNLALNEVGGAVRLEEGDFSAISSPAQIVLANLTGHALEQSAARLAELVEVGGYLVISGFLENEDTAVIAALEKFLTLQKIDREDEWICGVLIK